MPLLGHFERQTLRQDSWVWYTKDDLKRETESLLLIATQEQLFNTNSVLKDIYLQVDSDKCRLHRKAVESLECPMVVQKQFKRRHDKIWSHLHCCICKKLGIEMDA